MNEVVSAFGAYARDTVKDYARAIALDVARIPKRSLIHRYRDYKETGQYGETSQDKAILMAGVGTLLSESVKASISFAGAVGVSIGIEAARHPVAALVALPVEFAVAKIAMDVIWEKPFGFEAFPLTNAVRNAHRLKYGAPAQCTAG